MASDIPETYDTPCAMARALSSYMSDPHAVRQAVLGCFFTAPEVHTIRRMRAEHLLPPNPVESWKAHEGYHPDKVRREADNANALFLEALDRERGIAA